MPYIVTSPGSLISPDCNDRSHTTISIFFAHSRVSLIDVQPPPAAKSIWIRVVEIRYDWQLCENHMYPESKQGGLERSVQIK